MLKRKAFIHWYTTEGLEEEELHQGWREMMEMTTEMDMFQDFTDDYAYEEEYDW